MAGPTKDRWSGIARPYSDEDVERLRGSLRIEHTLARRGAERLWDALHEDGWVAALGAVTGNQAMQQVRAGLKSIYVSGWQVAADANIAGRMYPDQSLYPANSVPQLVRRINHALRQADQIEHADGGAGRDWYAPIVADAEAGFGGPLNAYELMAAMIEAGAAGVHFEDQLSSEKKCGHMGGKVLVPTAQFIRTLTAARLAADVMDVPTVLIARTDANSAQLLTSDVDPRDHEFMTGERTAEGFFACAPGCTWPSPADWPTPRSPTCCGARPRLPISTRPGVLPRRFTTSSQTSSWRTTALPRSTGRPSWTATRSPASSASCRRWDTSTSS